jgi:hypothetical protein
MKKYSFFGSALLALTMIFFAGCDKVNDLDDFKFHSEFVESVPMVDDTPNGASVAYSKEITVDATADSEVNKYKSKIKSFKIDKLSYTIDNSKNPTPGAKFSGTLGFSTSDGGSATVLTTITGLDLDDHAAVHDVTLAQADLDKLAGYLNADRAFKIYLAGTVSKTPVNVMVNVKTEVAVVANAL